MVKFITALLLLLLACVTWLVAEIFAAACPPDGDDCGGPHL